MNYSKTYLIKVNLLVFILMCVLLITLPFINYKTILISFLLSYIIAYVVGFNMFHRYWAHKQFNLTKVSQLIFGYLGLFTMAGDALTIARTHRYHHKFSDTDKDLHSPLHGRFRSFIGWMFDDVTPTIPLSTVRDLLTPEYNYLKIYLRHQVKIIWITLFVVSLISLEVLLGLTMGMCMSFIMEMLANSFLTHSTKTKTAYNNKFYSYISMTSLHLDHHTRPNAINKNDPGLPLLNLFSKLKILSYR